MDTSLTALGLANEEGRRDWAIRKAEQLGRQRQALAAGEVVRAPTTSIRQAIEAYLSSCVNRLRPTTIAAYQAALARFGDWSGIGAYRQTADLDQPALATFKQWLLSGRRHTQAKGKPRGVKQEGTRKRSAHSHNHVLRAVKTMLTEWRRQGLVPRLSSDAIADALANLRGPRAVPAFLRPAEIRALLETALRHDGDTYAMTRSEKRGDAPTGSTAKHDPIAPFLLFVLLSGCRAGEAQALRWDAVDPQARDEHGNEAGEIRLTPADTKTATGRVIDLSVTPALQRLLATLHLARGENEFVFGGVAPLVRGRIEADRRRLINTYGAPTFSWQRLRQTTSSYLVNAPGIFGAAAAFRAARQLGHSVVVAEQRYSGLVRGIPATVKTLEGAMSIEDLVERVLGAFRSSRPGSLLEATGSSLV